MTAIALAEWNQAREAGVPAFAVGPVARPVLYLDRTEAEKAAAELDGTYIEWTGRTGHQVLTTEAEAEAFAEPEPEAEI